jgi:eukaryotic-like serine/threonine-protein kinase
MSSNSAEWHLLFGLLALQNGVISRQHLVAAFAKWTSDKSLPLDQILVADQAVSASTCETLKQLVELHIQHHEGDPQKSLMALSGSDLPGVRADLARLQDADLHQSIASMPVHDAWETQMQTVGNPTSRGGRFRVLRPLPGARGGMGEISVATDEELGRQVALKQILPDKADDEYFRQKFQVEAEITGNLEHPGIVPIYGLGRSLDGRPYYAMRLVRGDNLSTRIKQFHEWSKPGDFNSVEFRTLIDRLVDVAQAIRYAHSRGVLHRDLKPGNILAGEYGETLVIDWGLARLPRAEEALAQSTDEGIDGKAPLNIRSGSNLDATIQGGQLGTVGYAPPEQLNGRVDLISERSDVYGLGAILYQILTGRPPLDRQGPDRNFAEVIRDTIEGRIVPPRQVHPSIPKPLSAICLKALQREPAERYDSAAAFLDDLERWKADQPIAAAPDSLADRLMRLTRRYRNAALATAATLIGIAVVALIAALYINQARVREAQALAKESEARAKSEKLAEEKSELAQRNQTVVDNFVAAFRSPDPANESTTSQMTALDVLKQALVQIGTDDNLSKDALTKATLLSAIGESLQSLGEYNQAVSAFEETLRLRKAALREDHPDTLTNMNGLASAYQYAGRRAEALPLYEETLRLRKAALGEEHPDTLQSTSNLALAYLEAGRPEEALPLFEETLRHRKAALGEEDQETLQSMNNLAGAYLEAGRLDEALPLFEETLRLRKTRLGEDHPETLTTMDNLASALRAAGRHDESLTLVEETVRLMKSKLGEDHPFTLIGMSNLAHAYQTTDRLDEALGLVEEVLRLRKARLGEDHPDTLTSKNNLAMAYEKVGRRDEALRLFEENLRLTRAKLGEDHPETLTSMNNLASAFRDANRLDEALPLYEKALRLRKARLGEDHPDTLSSIHNLAGAYQVANRLDEALPLYEETLRLRKARLGEDHPDTLSSMNNLASAYHEGGRSEEALPLFEETLRLRKGTLGADHPSTLISMNNVAHAYQAAGRLDEALPLFEDALRLRKARLGEDHPATLISLRSLQEALLITQDFDAAKRAAEDWLLILEQQSKPDRPQVARANVSLAEALLGMESYSDARERVETTLGIDEIEGLQRLRALNVKGAIVASMEKWEEAEPLLIDSATVLSDQLSEMKINSRWYVPRACVRVIAMYEAWGKLDEAARWETKLAEVNAEIVRLRNYKLLSKKESEVMPGE